MRAVTINKGKKKVKQQIALKHGSKTMKVSSLNDVLVTKLCLYI